jgi:trimethylamine--corrinoid protein Co-methyltransferase
MLKDLYDFARLADTLDNIHIFVRTVVARDMENSRDLDINTAYDVIAGTKKPVGTSFFKPKHVLEVGEMYDIACGGQGSFAPRPF